MGVKLAKSSDVEIESMDKQNILINIPTKFNSCNELNQVKFLLSEDNTITKKLSDTNLVAVNNDGNNYKDCLSNYSMIKTLGRGNFGKVLLVRSKKDDNFYAVKVLKKVQIVKLKYLDQIKLEKKILLELDHPFIIKIYSTFQTLDKIFLKMEFCNGGEIFFHLRNQIRFSEEITKFYAAQIYLAIAHLHSKKILYRDLKPENIMLDKEGNIKIIDFGMVKDNFEETNPESKCCGTLEYLAPEVIDGKPYGFNFDWWGFGILVYEMLVGVPPFQDDSRHKLFNKIKTKEPNYKYYGNKISISDDAIDLISKLLMKEPEKRIQFESIKNHKWFEGIDFDDILKKKIKSPFIPKVNSPCDISNFDKEFLGEECLSPQKSKLDYEDYLIKYKGKIF
jgi:serine/threonine protein kinase